MQNPDDLFARARKYLVTLPDSIEGQKGHDALFRAATVLAHGFAFDESTALDLLEYSENTLSAAKHNNGFIAGWFKGNEWKAWIIHRLGDGKWYWQTDIKTFTPAR